jgi:aspartokinase/homoserine dehydrogenase 1
VKVIKFGGTSVGSAENIRKVMAIISGYHSQNQPFAVVASAVSGITNCLIATATQASQSDERYLQGLKEIEEKHIAIIRSLMEAKVQSQVFAQLKSLMNELEDLLHGVFLIKELPDRSLDLVLSFGERLSNYILTEALKQQGIPAQFLDARRVIKTDNHFGTANVNFEETDILIRNHFSQVRDLQVITGFIGSTDKNETTTLGRGGSDYTAAIVAAALQAEEIEIWTDVDGIMTADPRKVKRAFTLPTVSYTEAMEMSHFGAKVIYPPTLQPAFSKKIPIRIRNTFHVEHEGTLISEKTDGSGYLIKGISSIDHIALITLQGSGLVGVAGVAARLFGALAKHYINIILITQASSEHSICFAVLPQFAPKVKRVVEEEFVHELEQGSVDPIVIEDNGAIVAVIGENMRKTVGVSAKLFGTLGRNGISVSATAQGSSEQNISVVIDQRDLSKALNALHESFFLSQTKSLNLFLVGPGLVGGTLLRQIEKQADYLRQQLGINPRLIGLANSRRMVFDEEKIEFGHWRERLQGSEEPMNLEAFTRRIIELNLPNSVFVDCTASPHIISQYIPLLQASVSVVTPNKYANAGPLSNYRRLHEAASRYGVSFCYETNVGAGLPVISTLKDLMHSGDKILKIEAVLSGSVSFIFNSFRAGTRFSRIVQEAKERGYTEPDPREDLTGADVARKILILARESGMAIEAEEVVIHNFLPSACLQAPSIPAFFSALEAADPYFEQRREEAEAAGRVLRFVATLENGQATIQMQAVEANHPFASLSGSDNMIVFTTERYRERPLVIKGPGAGSEVTAAGIFAEIIKCSS